MDHRQTDRPAPVSPGTEAHARYSQALPAADGSGPASVRPDHNKFDPCLSTRDGTSAHGIATAVRSSLDAAISRKRRRRLRDADIFTGLIDAIVANLIDNHLKSGAVSACDPAALLRWISVPLSGRHLRKGSRLFSATPLPLSSLPDRLCEMESLGFVIIERAPQHR
jgi:hypothetical protein